jgi:radical S-adenosyl methionine domain-containing protein 2
VDSLVDESNIISGRAILGKKPITKSAYFEIVDKIKSYGYGLKINTVVSSKNYEESMLDFIEYSKPSRWKIFQVLAIMGQNDLKIGPFLTSKKQFNHFIANHKLVETTTKIVSETNDQIKGSYVMVDPAGRFFENITGKHIYSDPILEVGYEKAIQQMAYDKSKFEERGGNYDWVRIKRKVA